MINIFAKRNIGSSEVQIVVGDIVDQPDDAIVNATNAKLLEGPGVSAAIFRAAVTKEIENACKTLAPIGVSDAVITPGFLLPNPHIIHCCGPQYNKDSDAKEKLESCYRNILALAEENQVSSLAIPAISTGAYGFPSAEATRICINVIKESSPKLDSLKTIRLVVRDKVIAKIYASYLMEVVPLPDNAVRVDFDAQFSQEQFQRIRKGFIGDQDYKWFFYFDDPWLYIFRAARWVGQCWWFLKFEPTENGYKVAEAWADSESMSWLKKDFSDMLHFLIYSYLPDSHGNINEYTPLMGDISNSYCVLSNSHVKLSINNAPISNAEVKALGARLMALADKLEINQQK